MTSKDIFDSGFCLPLYDLGILKTWKFKEEEYKTGYCPTEILEDLGIRVARIEEVRSRAL